jgi:hypothetical protein
VSISDREKAILNSDLGRCVDVLAILRSEKDPKALRVLRRLFLGLKGYSTSIPEAARLLRECCISMDCYGNMRPYTMFGSLWHAYVKYNKGLCQKYRTVDELELNEFIKNLEELHNSFRSDQMNQRWI